MIPSSRVVLNFYSNTSFLILICFWNISFQKCFVENVFSFTIDKGLLDHNYFKITNQKTSFFKKNLYKKETQ